MLDVLRAEWTKLRTVRSTGWSFVAIVGLTIGLTAFVCSFLTTEGGSPGEPGDDDVVSSSLSGVVLGQIAVAALAALAVTAEYATGMIRTSFTAVRRRHTVLLAKVIVVATTVLVLGVAAGLGAFAVAQPILHRNGYVAANGYPAASITDAATARAVAGTALYLALFAMLSVGLAMIMRHTAATVTTVLGLLFVPYMAALTLPEHPRHLIQQVSPMTAGLAVQRTVDRADSVPIGPWAGLAVLAAWAAVALALGFWLTRRRDA